MKPIITSAAPAIPPDRYSAICLNNTWHVLETVGGKSYIIATCPHETAARFLANCANAQWQAVVAEQYRRRAQKQLAFLVGVTTGTRSLN